MYQMELMICIWIFVTKLDFINAQVIAWNWNAMKMLKWILHKSIVGFIMVIMTMQQKNHLVRNYILLIHLSRRENILDMKENLITHDLFSISKQECWLGKATVMTRL